jgi:hypothetical protein
LTARLLGGEMDQSPSAPGIVMPRCSYLVAVCSLLIPASWGEAAERIDFAHDVLPILQARCAECHTAGKSRGNLSMNTRASLLRAKVIVPGKSAASPLVARITATDDKQRMPPKGKTLTAKEIATLKAWIDQGAPWQEGFSFAKPKYAAPLKLTRPSLPPAREGRTNPIDHIVDAYLTKRKLPALRAVDDAAFLRRVSLDVVGLLPEPEQLDAFLADPAKDKRARKIRELLKDNRAYAEHWLTMWNDLLRNDYAGTGYIDGGRKQISDWLYRSLVENKPYDRFVRELISPTAESEGFIKGIRWRGVVNASQVVELQFSQNISQVFLGINMKCASCHDSFIDDWKLTDAYGLAAIIAERPLTIHRCDKSTGVKAKARFLFPELGAIDSTRPRKERLERLAALMTHKDNGRFSRTIVNRLWHRLMGRGIVDPVDVMSNEPWSADLLDYLAGRLVEDGYDLKKTIELIVSSHTYQAASVPLTADSAGDYVFRGAIARRMTAEQFLDSIWRITGTAPALPAMKSGPRGKDPVRASLVAADPLMRSLGRPNREQVVSTRPEELSTLVALDLTNGRELAGLLERGAGNLRKRRPAWKGEEMAVWLWKSALCRPPSREEKATARSLLGEKMTNDSLADLLWAVFMLPEFQLIR